MSGNRIEVDSYIFVRRDGQQLLSPEKVRLLKEIERSGSLRDAAACLQISYQHAWKLIEAVNKAAAKPVVSKQRGGVGGGGASMTEYGAKLLADYFLIEKEVNSFIKKLNVDLNL